MISDDFNGLSTSGRDRGADFADRGFQAGRKGGRSDHHVLSDIYTIAVNLAGLPGLSLPVGFAAGLPVGLQLIGDYSPRIVYCTRRTAISKPADWHLRAPAFA